MNATIIVEAIKLGPDPLNTTENVSVYKQTTSPTFFEFFGISLWEFGKYNITGSIVTNSSNTPYSYTIIELIPWTQKQFFPFFIASVLSFLAIIIISAVTKIRIKIYSEALRFLFISALVFSVVATFLFVNEEVGSFGPFGLVTTKDPITPSSASQWVINIGGSRANNYELGVNIPVYVFLFGIAGGYLRYLYKTAKMRPSVVQSSEKYLLKWVDIPGPDSSKLRDFLMDRFDIEWIKGKEFVKSDKGDKSVAVTADNNHSLIVTINPSNTEAFVRLDDRSTSCEFAVAERENNYI